MLAYMNDPKHDEVTTTSLIRLMAFCNDPAKVPALSKALSAPSPLVRAAAVEALGQSPSMEALQGIAAATADDYRLVRVRAAAALAQFPNIEPQGKTKEQIDKATDEYLAFIMARPDQWTSHYNMGNYQLSRGENKSAVASYRAALKIEPKAILALVNLSIAYARMGDGPKAERSLQEALKIAPDNGAANFNMGLLKAEKKEPKEAEQYLKKAIKADPQMAQAAYNLCIITSKDRIGEAVTWCRRAADLRPQEPRYAFTLAFYQNRKGDKDEAVKTLKAILEKYPGYRDAEMLLKEISR
jgi:tetratricopeptide (TPR) repeat protein